MKFVLAALALTLAATSARAEDVIDPGIAAAQACEAMKPDFEMIMRLRQSGIPQSDVHSMYDAAYNHLDGNLGNTIRKGILLDTVRIAYSDFLPRRSKEGQEQTVRNFVKMQDIACQANWLQRFISNATSAETSDPIVETDHSSSKGSYSQYGYSSSTNEKFLFSTGFAEITACLESLPRNGLIEGRYIEFHCVSD